MMNNFWGPTLTFSKQKLGYPFYFSCIDIDPHSLKIVHVRNLVKLDSLSRLNSSPLEHKNPQTDAFWVNNSACC